MMKHKRSVFPVILMLLADFLDFCLLKTTKPSPVNHPKFSGWEGCFTLKRFLFLLFILATSNCQAATYYFSASGNNTTGSGTLGSPFYSLCGPWSGAPCTTGVSKISLGQIPINPGDMLPFKRGGEWKEGLDAHGSIHATSSPGIHFYRSWSTRMSEWTAGLPKSTGFIRLTAALFSKPWKKGFFYFNRRKE